MSKDIEILLAEIDAFLARSRMAETTFGAKAANDGKFVGRLRNGKRCWPETIEKVRAYIRKAGEELAA